MNTWTINTTHGMTECKGCHEAAQAAVALAKCTGSTEATHSDGLHAAKVSREVTR
jgi:hypothetical protein